MKTSISRKSNMFIIVLTFLGTSIFQACSNPGSKSEIYRDLLKFTDGIKVISTHEHQRSPEEFGMDSVGFYHILGQTYLYHDLVSSGMRQLNIQTNGVNDVAELWKQYGEPFNNCRSTSYYGHLIKGFQKLYDFNEYYFTKLNISILNAQIVENYADYQTWFNSAFDKAGFELMFVDRYWNSLECDIDQDHYGLIININNMVMYSSRKPSPDSELDYIYKKASDDGLKINTLDDYLSYCNIIIQNNIEKNAVAFKSSLAYARSIEFKEVPYEDASRLFAQDSWSLSQKESQLIQDYVFHWVVKKTIEHQLPLQIHTGYLAGSGNQLYNSDPLKLINLIRQYPEAKFSLFHGGYPWTSEFIALGKMFPNVYLDLVWLPQISREKAVLALDEMLDCVPYNKIFWGGDCAFIEETTGALEYGKSVVAEVLAKRVERGLLTEDIANEIAKGIFRDNAAEVFRLEEILGRAF